MQLTHKKIKLAYLICYAVDLLDIVLIPFCHEGFLLALATLLTVIGGTLWLRLLMRDLDERDHLLWDLLNLLLLACVIARIVL